MEHDAPALRTDWRHEPATGRLPANAPRRAEIIARHDAAIERSLPTYPDPVSSLSVFTADFLARRGYCCDSGCRHCPYLQE